MKFLQILAVFLAGAQAARAAGPVEINFETDDAKYTLHRGEVTTAAGEVISGSRSLLGDSRGKEVEWFEFFTSEPGLVGKGNEYKVTFSYRPVRAAEGARLYALFRSRRKGWGQWDRGWTNFGDLEAGLGTVKRGNLTVGLDVLDDYQLMFGINGDARVAIDDIRITAGEPYREPTPEEKIMAGIPETAELTVELDFEGRQDPATVRLTSLASVSSNREHVITGERSLLIDTTSSRQTWNEAMRLGGGSFSKGFTYHIFFRHKGLSTGQGAYAYLLLRSAGHGPGKTDLGWKQWKVDPGQKDVAYRRVEVSEFDDYYLIIGTHKGARLSIDDLVVRRERLAKRPLAERRPFRRTDANLVWRDEFDGGSIDAEKWKIEGDHRRRGGYWMKEDAYLDGKGRLVVRFKKRPDGKYSGGSITSRPQFTHGYFEARMKLPTQVGHWPGFWLFSGSVNRVGDEGRDGTEVDIVEAPWRNQDRVSHALHWDGYGPEHAQKGHHVDVPGVNRGWHTFAAEWSPDGYIFFVDGRETWRSDAGGVCENPLNILVTDEVGGWSGNPDRASLPDYTYVDYVRVWQEKRDVTPPAEE